MRLFNRAVSVAALLIVALSVFLAFGCNPTGEKDGDTSQVVTVIVGPTGQPSASPSPGSCPPITRVGVSATLNGAFVQQWRVGEEPRLDVTPLNGSTPVPESCHGNSVQWALSGTATCTLTGDTAWFVPGIRCTAPGSINVQAAVAPPGGVGAASFTVVP